MLQFVSSRWSVVSSRDVPGFFLIHAEAAIDFVVGGRWSVVRTHLAAFSFIAFTPFLRNAKLRILNTSR